MEPWTRDQIEVTGEPGYQACAVFVGLWACARARAACCLVGGRCSGGACRAASWAWGRLIMLAYSCSCIVTAVATSLPRIRLGGGRAAARKTSLPLVHFTPTESESALQQDTYT